MLSEYEATHIHNDVTNRLDTSLRPVLGLAGVLMIVAGLGWLVSYDWSDSGARIVPQAQQQV